MKFGSPIAILPSSWWVLSAFFLAITVVTVTFLATATFPRKESVGGILGYSRGEKRVTVPKFGIVSRLPIHEGQAVHEGDLLAYISTEQHFLDGDLYNRRLNEAVERERGMLEQRLAALDAGEPLQAASFRARIEGITRQIDELGRDRIGRVERLRIGRDSFHAADSLVPTGNYSVEQARQRQQQVLAYEQSISELDGQVISLQSQKLDLELQLARLPADTAQTRAEIQRTIAALEERIADVAAQSGFALVARKSGTVTALQVQIGAPVDPVKPLMTIIPDGSMLQAELYVPSRAVGFIAPGQNVRLLYDAFPYTRFGPAFGTVVEVSSTVLRPEELVAAVKVAEPVYRVVVALKSDHVAGYGRAMPLQSGMALQADIILEERSFLDLLLDPLRAARIRTL